MTKSSNSSAFLVPNQDKGGLASRKTSDHLKFCCFNSIDHNLESMLRILFGYPEEEEEEEYN